MIAEHQAITHIQTDTNQLYSAWMALFAHSCNVEWTLCGEKTQRSSKVQSMGTVFQRWPAKAHEKNTHCRPQQGAFTHKIEVSILLAKQLWVAG